MAENQNGKRGAEPPVRDEADVEREASGTDTDTMVAPGEERKSERTRREERGTQPGDDVE